MKLQGKITFSMSASNQTEERKVRIEVKDKLSGAHFLVLEMSPADFTLATVGSLSHTPCEFELRPVNVGKVREYKTELVPLGRKCTEDEKAEALAQLEVDGWQANKQDIGNHNRWAKDGSGWYVNLVRWVEKNA